ncbi:MAG TPA: class I SAM-dependent methyltransferase [Verrucomicrobiae bacterium]|nr:class I SAM-dependent methyltransferase [Verrucomicrobiae bacterium]
MDNRPPESSATIEGQLNARERAFIFDTIANAPVKTRVALEVGTWLGGGSTLHILRALEKNGMGHLYGIEADRSIYERMIANIRGAAPEAAGRFTPLFGMSMEVLPSLLKSLPEDQAIGFAFLDGGDSPLEQIEEFKLLAPHICAGGVLAAHDARMRKGKWLAPYVSLLDNWKSEVLDLSVEGVFSAHKLAAEPSPASLRAAERKLARMRLEPKEFLSRFMPRWCRGLVLRLLPRHLSRRLTLGPNVAKLDNPA